MFTLPHYIWLSICVTFITVSLIVLLKKKVELQKVINIMFVIAIVCELIKILGSMKMISNEEGNYYPYIAPDYLPFHLCTIQILLISFVRFSKPSKIRTTILAFMFPTCLLGAFLAILMPSTFGDGLHPFKDLVSYEYFIYHSCLVIFGFYIALSKQVEIKAKNYFTTIAILLVLGFISLYLNAAFSVVDYEKMEYLYVVNFFFTFDNPLGIKMTELWHWYLYLVIIFSAVFILIGIVYYPFFVKYFKEKKFLKEKGEL